MKSAFTPRRTLNPRRIVGIGGAILLTVYVLFVVTGYVWVNYGLKNRRITFSQVAFFRWRDVRRDMAAQQLAEAKTAWDKRDYAAAYLAFSSAVRNDPDNVDARCTAAHFFLSVGAPKVTLALLETGLDHTPDDVRICTELLEILTSTGRDQRALELLHGRLAARLSSPHEGALQTFEVLATLNLRGVDVAKQLFARYSAIREYAESAPVVARVLWETGDRLKAIDVLSDYVGKGRGGLIPCAQLADWQSTCGMVDDARQTAERACARFPQELPPRVLLIDKTPYGSREWSQAVQSYLGEFGARPEALPLLADLAGRRGWVDFARSLYLASATKLSDLNFLAIAYADALIFTSHFSEARAILSQVETQAQENNTRLTRLVRDRQILVAGALGDHDGARQHARRLAASLRDDPEALEGERRRFSQMHIPEAVAELSLNGTVARASSSP